MLDIEIVNTDKPITGIRKRSILTDLQRVNTDYHKLHNIIMKMPRDVRYKKKQMLIDLIEKAIEVAYIEGQRTGTVRTEFIKGEIDETRREDVYRERTDNYVGD